jgi:hypothetical protein
MFYSQDVAKNIVVKGGGGGGGFVLVFVALEQKFNFF